MAQAEWYVAHTYSGYENKVKADLEKTIENRQLQDKIFEVTIPMEQVLEERETGKKLVERKMFPGYVLVHMIMDDETWYVIRNTRGVTGFVGPGSKPVPLSEAELIHMGLLGSEASVQVKFAVNDYIVVVSGVWEGTTGKVVEVNDGKRTVTIMVEMFGRETPVELNFNEIKQM